MNNCYDMVVLLVCLLLICIGYILGASSDLFVSIKITDILTSVGTIGAVVVALWSTKLNVSRDKHNLIAEITILPKYKTVGSVDGGFQLREITVNKPKSELTVFNSGLRPVAIKEIVVIDKFGKHNNLSLLKRNMSENTVIQPGNFFRMDLSSSQVGDDYEKAISNNYFVVDAFGDFNQAKIIGNESSYLVKKHPNP